MVPFTLAHAAAALPLRRLKLVPSALVIGTFAPDFEYFVHPGPNSRYGHTFPGVFLLTLPLALLVLWMFHTVVKRPLVGLLPDAMQRRVVPYLEGFRFGGAARFLLIVASVLLGITTHVLWDSFTHSNTWPYHHWGALRQMVHIPVVGMIPIYRILQHSSSLAGTGITAIWLQFWYRDRTTSDRTLTGSPSASRKKTIVALVVAVAILGGLLRAFVWVEGSSGAFSFRSFAGRAVITAIALTWWQLVAYGLFFWRDSSSDSSDLGRRAESESVVFGNLGTNLETAAQTALWEWFHLEQTRRENGICRFQPNGPAFHSLSYLDVAVNETDEMRALALGVQRGFIDGGNAPFARDLVKSLLYAVFPLADCEPVTRLIRELESEFGGSRPILVAKDGPGSVPVGRPSDPYRVFLGQSRYCAVQAGSLRLELENLTDEATNWFCLRLR